MEEFQFTRPFWFLALLPLLLLLIMLIENRHSASPWRGVIDAHLLPYLLVGERNKRSPLLPFYLLGLYWLLLVTALAGPVWQRVPAVEFRPQVPPLVILLDLSRSMNTRDLAPSRIALAKSKLVLLLERLSQRSIALSVYTLRGHSVMPFTEDRRLIQQTLESLTPELMPVQGSLASAGLNFGAAQLRAFGAKSGELLLVTDGADAALPDVARQLALEGYRVSVLGVGTTEGGTIPDERRNVLLSDSGPVYSRLDAAMLRQVADQGNGYYAAITRDDRDLLSLQEFFTRNTSGNRIEQSETTARVWLEGGPWLILIALPLFLLIARPGTLLTLLLLALVPLPPPAQASDWPQLWLNRNQLALVAFEAGDYRRAASIFEDPLWRGIAQYRDGQYPAALLSFNGLSSPVAHYNRGNTLVKLGRLSEAIQAYRETLRLFPEHQNARFNLQLIETILTQADGDEEPAESAAENKDGQPSGDARQEAARSVAEMLDAPTENDLAVQVEGAKSGIKDAGTAGGGAMLIDGGERTDLAQSSTVGEGLTRDGVAGGERNKVARQGDSAGGAPGDQNRQIFRNQALSTEQDSSQTRQQPAGDANSGSAEGNDSSGPDPSVADISTGDPPGQKVSDESAQPNRGQAGASGNVESGSQNSADEVADKDLTGAGIGPGEAGADNSLATETGEIAIDRLKNWIDAIADNPAELLREKFRRDYQRAPASAQGENPW